MRERHNRRFRDMSSSGRLIICEIQARVADSIRGRNNETLLRRACFFSFFSIITSRVRRNTKSSYDKDKEKLHVKPFAIRSQSYACDWT